MKRLIKNNVKLIIAFLFGVVISSGTIYAATVSFDSNDVEHTKSNGTTTTVKNALNDLYTIHNGGTAAASDILTGKTAYSGGSLISGSMSKPTSATGNSYTGVGGYLNNGSSALSSSTSLTLSSYLSSNQYNFKIGSGEQVTFPAGYYQYPINISNIGGKKVAFGRYEASTSSMQTITTGFRPSYICVFNTKLQIFVYDADYKTDKQIKANTEVAFPATDSNTARLHSLTSNGFKVCKAASGYAVFHYWFAVE